jgi:hypothetical protein
MRNPLAIAAVIAVVATGAVAQTQDPPAIDGPRNSTINSPDSSNRQVNAPVAGRNSFTEGEANSASRKWGSQAAVRLSGRTLWTEIAL